jgi:hypothetical protein
MRTNQNNKNSQQTDNNSGKSVTRDGDKEDNYAYNRTAGQYPSKGSVKYCQPTRDSSSIRQMEYDGAGKDTPAYEYIGNRTPDEETKKYQITDEELIDENLHGNTF